MSTRLRTQAWSEAAEALADCLARENEALARIDYAAVAALGEEKHRALQALERAQETMGGAALPLSELKAIASRLDALAHDNRRLLKRAMAVQSRVIDCFARAMRGVNAAPRYGASGTIATSRSMSPVTFVARA